jgi:hypothetical protein
MDVDTNPDFGGRVLDSCRLDGRRSRDLEIPYKCCPPFSAKEMRAAWREGWNERHEELNRPAPLKRSDEE